MSKTTAQRARDAWMRRFQPFGFPLPVVRRVTNPLVANDLVSIQPMSQPSALLFYMDYKYGNDDEKE